MWITELTPAEFWPGFWVNLITFPLAITATLLGIGMTRRVQNQDRRRQQRGQRAALLRLTRHELERNITHVRGVSEQGGLGPLVAGSEAWDAVRGELVALSDPSDERFERLLQAVTEAHSWCASTMGIMEVNMRVAVQTGGIDEGWKRFLDCNVAQTVPYLESAIQLVESAEAELAA